MELGLVRSAVAGVTQPTPPAPEPVQTAAIPELDRARAVAPMAATALPVTRRDWQVALAWLPPAVAAALPAPEKVPEDDGERARPLPTAREAAAVAVAELQRRFDLDASSKQLVFRMIDVATGEVVRQLPQEDRLRLQEMLRAFGAALPSGRTARYDGSF